MPGVTALLDIVFISLSSGVARLVGAPRLTGGREGGPLPLDINYFLLGFPFRAVAGHGGP